MIVIRCFFLETSSVGLCITSSFFSLTTKVNSGYLSLTSSKSGSNVPTSIPIIPIQFSGSCTSTVDRMISRFTSKLKERKKKKKQKKTDILDSVACLTRACTMFLGDITKTRGVLS